MPFTPENAWQAVVGQLQLDMPKASFDTWVRDAEFLSFDEDEGIYRIRVANAYAVDWLKDRLTSTVQRLLVGVLNRGDLTVQFEVYSAPASKEILFEEDTVAEEDDHPKTLAPNATLNRIYTFETFVESPETALGFAAARSVVADRDSLGARYNPLFIYGRSGTGKTHLLHAIGNAAMELGVKILYVTSEDFTNDLIVAIRTHQTPVFREKYRTADLLLVDDIGFFAGKEATCEEFFHTFNAIVGKGGQVVLASELAPRDHAKFEDRLKSRFVQGLPVDLQPLKEESRTALLQGKNRVLGLKLADEILVEIARVMSGNVRHLEGAMKRVSAYATLTDIEATPEMVSIWLADLIPEEVPEPDQIINAVLQIFGLTEEELVSKKRAQKVALPRQVAMYLLREDLRISLPEIGERLGGRDHTTVMYGVDKIVRVVQTDEVLAEQIADVRAMARPVSVAA